MAEHICLAAHEHINSDTVFGVTTVRDTRSGRVGADPSQILKTVVETAQ